MTWLADHNAPFAAALLLMVLLAIAQAIGLGDMLGDADVDADIDGDTTLAAGPLEGLASLFGIGRVPFMVWLALFLFLFAAVGFGIQHLAEGFTGAPLDRWLAAVLAAVGCLPVTGVLARPLGRLLPHDETTAVSIDALVGRRATITEGIARSGSPARARVIDRHGHPHHVMVEPHEATSELHAGDEVLLVRREGNQFYATALAEHRLSPG